MPVILSTQETEMRRNSVQTILGKKFEDPILTSKKLGVVSVYLPSQLSRRHRRRIMF
jgi:hypothetical protein